MDSEMCKREYDWNSLGSHIRLLASHPDIQDSNGVAQSDLFDWSQSAPSPSQREAINVVRQCFDPACYENSSAAAQSLESFLTGYYIRRALGFRYAAVASYLFVPILQRFLRRKGLLRCSFMVGSKYPHVDHPAHGAIQLPPIYVESSDPVADAQAHHLCNLLAKTAHHRQEYKDLTTVPGLVKVLKESEVAQSVARSDPFSQGRKRSPSLRSAECYETLAGLVQRHVFKMDPTGDDSVADAIRPWLKHISESVLRAASVLESCADYRRCIKWSLSEERICQKARLILGLQVAQIVSETCLSRVSKSDRPNEHWDIGIPDQLLILDREIRECKEKFQLLPSPSFQVIFRGMMRRGDRWAFASWKLPAQHRRGLPDSFLVCLVDEKKYKGATEDELSGAILSNLIRPLGDALLPLGRVAVETDLIERQIQAEVKREVAITVAGAGHRLKTELGGMLEAARKMLELLKRQPLELEKARKECGRVELLTEAMEKAAECMIFMEEMVYADNNPEKLDPNRWFASRDTYYPVGRQVRKVLKQITDTGCWDLRVDEACLTLLDEYCIGETPKTAAGRWRLWDGFYDDIFYEVLYNAAKRTNNHKLEVGVERITVQFDQGARDSDCITFSNTAEQAWFCGLTLDQDKWTSWSTGKRAHAGGLAFIALRLRALGPNDLLVKTEVAGESASWFRVALVLEGLVHRKGCTNDSQ